MSQADTVLKFPLNAPLAEIDGRLYMVGAYPLDFDLNSFTSDPVALTFGSLMRYDPFTNVWEALAPWPRPRYSPAVAAVNGKLHIFGGADAPPFGAPGNPVYTHDVYDPETDTWSTAADMPSGIVSPFDAFFLGSTETFGGKIYAFFINADSEVGEYDPDPEVDAWTIRPPPPLAGDGVRIFAASAIFNGKIYLFGGANNTGVLADVESYDPVADTWTIEPSMPKAALWLWSRGVTMDDGIHLYGGLMSDFSAFSHRHLLFDGVAWSSLGSAPSGSTQRALDDVLIVGEFDRGAFTVLSSADGLTFRRTGDFTLSQNALRAMSHGRANIIRPGFAYPHLFRTAGAELDKYQNAAAEIARQRIPALATWGIPFLETEYGLPSFPNRTRDQRRSGLIFHRSKFGTANRAKMIRIADRAGVGLKIDEIYDQYRIRYVTDVAPDAAPNLGRELRSQTPSHLEVGVQYACALTWNQLDLKGWMWNTLDSFQLILA